MRKIVSLIAVALFVVTFMFDLHASTLAGVTLPDRAQVGGKTLVLNGLGVRSKMMVKVYVAGLYLEQKSSDANTIINVDAPKQIVMRFLHSLSKIQMTDALSGSMNDNTPDAQKTMKADVDRLLGALEAVEEGDQMVFTYLPGTGTTLAINGSNKLTVSGQAFSAVIFSLWLGSKPPDVDLKAGMLGK